MPRLRQNNIHKETIQQSYNQVNQIQPNIKNPMPLPTNNVQNAQIPSDSVKIYGSKKMTSFLIFFVPLILMAPLISYYMAVKSGEEHKFPHPTITDTACHYPQNIQFRLIMAGSGPFISLIYWVLSRWMKYQKQRIQYPGPIYSFLFIIGQVSVWGFMIAMGTIDGMWYPDLHTNSAIFFFVTLFLIVMTQTIVVRDMYQWDSSVISRKSYFIKMVLAAYVAIIWIYCVFGLVTEPHGRNDDEDQFIVILEWNSVYVCLFWILSYIPEWVDIRITMTSSSN